MSQTTKQQEEKAKNSAVEELVIKSSPDQDFFLMTLISVMMATLGVLLDSATIIIGSMLIAPLLYSIVSTSLGFVTLKWDLIKRSVVTLSKTIVLSLMASTILALIFKSARQSFQLPEILTIVNHTGMGVAVALLSGVAAAFALLEPTLNETLPGIAISVSLIPPLATVGVAISRAAWPIVGEYSAIFLINVAGILIASSAVFLIQDLYEHRTKVEESVEEEAKRLEEKKEKNKKHRLFRAV